MKLNLFAAAVLALAAMSFTTSDNARPWELLGVRKVNFALDRDEIVVTRAEGVFTALQLKIKRGPINMHQMVVHYGNGETQEIALKENFREGSESRVIDLAGNRRVIRKVVFVYDTKNFSDSKAEVELWGRH